MKSPSFADSFEVLCLQAADSGRGKKIFGDSLERARSALRPFMVGPTFPSVYLEFPLIGTPFLDVTVLFGELELGTRIESEVVGDVGSMLDWFAIASKEHANISCGFEVDTKERAIPTAAVHFQPRSHLELVQPFCTALGEPERAPLFLETAGRMPKGWPLSFFGVFRGRPDSPLRVCGYLGCEEQDACAKDPKRLESAFEAMGFSAYDDAMLAQVSTLMAEGPKAVDFQFDVYPDGSFGSTFAIDVQFNIARPEAVRQSFTDGVGARVMRLLEEWGIADARWQQGAQAAFAQAISVELEDGSAGRFSFTLMPQWVKARWKNGVLQPSKLYLFGTAGLLENAAKGKDPRS